MRNAGCVATPDYKLALPLGNRCVRIAERLISRRSYVLSACSRSSAMRAQIVQPPEPVDPSPINGEMYYLVNQVSGLQMDLNNNSATPGDNVIVNGRSFTNLSQDGRSSKRSAETGRSATFRTVSVSIPPPRRVRHMRYRIRVPSMFQHRSGLSPTRPTAITWSRILPRNLCWTYPAQALLPVPN